MIGRCSKCKRFVVSSGGCPYCDGKRDGSQHGDLKSRIERRVSAKRRFVDWITLFKREQDTGVGDATVRLLKACDDNPTKVMLRKKLRELLEGCSCAREAAITRLNDQFPFWK